MINIAVLERYDPR